MGTFAKAGAKSVSLIRVTVPVAQLRSAAVLDRFSTFVVLKQKVGSIGQAQELIDSYLDAAARR